MDEPDLQTPTVREGGNEPNIPEAAHEAISADDLRNWSQELWEEDLFPLMPQGNTEEKISPTMPEGDTEEKIPKAPHLWMQPDDLQQEEVKAQDALMREVVGLMLPTPSAILEGNAVSDIALLPADEVSRMHDLTAETELAQNVGLELGDE